MSPWELLGVPPQASEDAIRRAFQRLAVQVHPDKVHHLGEEFQRLAHIRFTELQKAYEELLRRARKEDGGTGEEV
jgi:curved DNA-binding protein CbpA